MAMTKNTTWYSAYCAFIHSLKCVVYGYVKRRCGTKAVSHRVSSVFAPHHINASTSLASQIMVGLVIGSGLGLGLVLDLGLGLGRGFTDFT